jgi:toxin ParE1/3/4
MASYKLTKRANEDLNQIWNYTNFKWSEEQADKYYNLIMHEIVEIANKPEIGRNYDFIFKSLLGKRVGKHIVFYKKLSVELILIIRILHVQMDIEARISE